MAHANDLDALLNQVAWVRQLAVHLCADVHRAEDAAQSAWLQAIRRPPRDPSAVRGFLVRTLHNVVRLQSRASQRRQRRERAAAFPIDAESPDAADMAARAELHGHLVTLVLALPEPRRQLVLRHYFEGEDIVAIARRLGCSGDAVRAHLRRARAQLRAALERSNGQVRRGYGLLLAATNTGALRDASFGSPLAIGGFVMSMKLVAAALAAMVVVCWCLPYRATLPAPAADVGARDPTKQAPALQQDAAGNVTDRTLVTASDLTVRLQLDGLHPLLPWTSAIDLRVRGRDGDGSHEFETKVAVLVGAGDAHLPGWTRECDELELRLTAADPWYEAVDQHGPTDLPGAGGLLRVPVRPATVVLGQVVDELRRAVAARVLVFASTSGHPRPPALGTTETADGNFLLRVDSDTELLVAAVPTSATAFANRVPAMVRADLLPAAVGLTTSRGPIEVAPIVLCAPVQVSGSVLWSDGRPVAEARVDLQPSALMLAPDLLLGWLQPDHLVVGRRCTTDAYGRFELPAFPGCAANLMVSRVGRHLTGPGRDMMRRVVAPQQVEFRLEGRPVLFRVLKEGKPTGPSRVEWSPGKFTSNYATDEDGELAMLVRPGPLRVRAFAGDESASTDWFEFPDGPPDVLDLHLQPLDRVAVDIHVEGTPELSYANFRWLAVDAGAQSGAFCVDMRRGDCRCCLHAGRYRLSVVDLANFLLANDREVAVPEGGTKLMLRLQRGGRLRVAITDANGHFVGGTCHVVGDGGVALQPEFTTPGPLGRITQGGVLADDAPSESAAVAAGSYEVVLDLGVHGLLRRTVTITAGAFAEVRVVLP